MERIKGTAPDDKFVVMISSSYTRGSSTKTFEIGDELWMQGDLMTPEVFFGEQYLFFDDYSEVDVRQVKDRGFWPDQLTELRILYLSPFTSFYHVPVVFFYQFFIVRLHGLLRTNVYVIAGAALLISAVFFLIKNRHKKHNLALIALTYSLLAMALTIPLLTDMY